MKPVRFGLIHRIALLVIAIEIAAFSALGWFYVSSFSSNAENGVRSRLRMVGQMIGRNEIAVSALGSTAGLVNDLVGAPYLRGVVIGGSGRVIVSSDPSYLGRSATSVPGIEGAWLDDLAPDEQLVAGADTLTGVTHVHNAETGAAVYITIITIGTADLNAQKRQIAFWGWMVSALFILVTSAAITLVAQRLITRRVVSSLARLKKVEDGALDTRIRVTSDDELGQLQHGINSMIAKLGALLDQHRRNEEEISTILDALTDGVIAVGADGRVLRCNPSAAAFLGGTQATYMGVPVAGLLPDVALGERQDWWCASESLTAGGRIHFERTAPDGGRQFIELGHGPIREAGGGAVLILQDVTARKQAEVELHDAVERLTVSNSELERFAYVASHDLQEPLRTITSFTQLLDRRLGGSLQTEDRENFAFVVGAAKRMSLLINDLLAYSRVNTRGIQFGRVSLQQACGAALDNLHETISESQAEITIEPLPDVDGDTIQLMQVFQNLIGNAVKFRRPGQPPQVTVSAKLQGGEWLISVRDNGIGVAASNQDIFEIFRRLHPASTFPGSGVGLAICKRIVQRHHGRIWFDSPPGAGTTFFFTLPVPGVEAPASSVAI
jgi:PAS domain S-box-containing protein